MCPVCGKLVLFRDPVYMGLEAYSNPVHEWCAWREKQAAKAGTIE